MIIRNTKLWLIRHGGANYFSFSKDLKVHIAALRKQILAGEITPEELAKTIFNRALNFKQAYMIYLYDSRPEAGVANEGGLVHPHSITINKPAIREYKELIASLPAEVRDKMVDPVTQKLIDLGKAEYNLSSFSLEAVPIVKAPLIELSFEVSKLLNELGLR